MKMKNKWNKMVWKKKLKLKFMRACVKAMTVSFISQGKIFKKREQKYPEMVKNENLK